MILAIRSVAAGASWWDQNATAEIQAVFQGDDAAPFPSTSARVDASVEPLENPLTPREREILALVADGKSNQEIAEILYITPGTVRVHVHAILQKLEVRDRTQAAIVALQKHLID